MSNSNKEGSRKIWKTTLQCDEMLELLKATNGHPMKIVLKRRYILMNGACLHLKHLLLVLIPQKQKKLTTTIVSIASLNLKSAIASSERQIPKVKILQMQFWNMVTMASQFSSTSNIHDVFLANGMEINHERNPKYRIN